MNWNIELFNFWHCVILAVSFLMPLVIWLIMRNKSAKAKYIFLLVFSILNAALFIARMLRIGREPWFNIWDELPFHLCNFGVFMNVAAMLMKNKTLYGFAYCFGSIGAFFAILVPTVHFLGSPVYEIGNISFYLQHAMIFTFGILLRVFGFVRFGVKDALKSTGILAVFALFAHGLNLAIASLGLGHPNYMFTVDASINPLLDMFYKLLPIPFLYLFLLFPLVAAVAALMCLPSWIGKLKKHISARTEIRKVKTE